MAWAIFTAALTCLVTTIISQIVIFFFDNSKKAREKRSKENLENIKTIVREEVREEVKPIKDEIEKSNKDNELIKAGLQQLLKIDLQSSYEFWLKKGYSPVAIKNDLEKLYWVYHNLGRNGVMDSMREKFNQLPNEKQR